MKSLSNEKKTLFVDIVSGIRGSMRSRRKYLRLMDHLVLLDKQVLTGLVLVGPGVRGASPGIYQEAQPILQV